QRLHSISQMRLRSGLDSVDHPLLSSPFGCGGKGAEQNVALERPDMRKNATIQCPTFSGLRVVRISGPPTRSVPTDSHPDRETTTPCFWIPAPPVRFH